MKKEDTPMRIARRKYEQTHKEKRKKTSKNWGTYLPREQAEEIDEFLKKYHLSKVCLITYGYAVLKDEMLKNKQSEENS